MDVSHQASLIALLGVVPGCTHAAGPEAERAPEAAVPVRDQPDPARGVTDAAAPAAPASGPEIPGEVLAARQTLLRFREHDAATLASARATLDAYEAPQRYEERGELEGTAYYYAREVYPSLGITIHHDGVRITNVEPTATTP
jgi:hypothetical protein